ncbi:peptidoglycan-binding domain-containing protein [Oceanirhabdus sp. W0125-5]|uniref:peptidoglycan-binding domain-containing protein n=1 Tax=Oceanirhabdus sp. W0125-5 TaxID=2999116 RepID=UPI0022F2B18C|nr:peptidoglycan-binding domain-containing protein [Oceanirhabdus sp. W0125-5]WBW96039.1 peptidoglycan-binding domain-containing protein [Oceanirhabdus sp. W0125-5]
MFVWVWEIENCIKKQGSYKDFVQSLKEIGINNLCIKFHEGSSEIGDGVNFKKAFLKYAPMLKKDGFKIGSWGYNYFNNITKESKLICEAINNSDYYIFDPEREVKGKKAESELILQIVREKHPKALIGYSSYPFMTYHKSIPYGVFDRYCDFFSPQTYFYEMNWSVNKCMEKFKRDYKEFGLKSKVIPSLEGFKLKENIYSNFQKEYYQNFGIWSLDFLDNEFIEWIKNHNVDRNSNKKDTIGFEIRNTVLELQKTLNYLEINDYDDNPLVEDGLLGEKTMSALEKCSLVYGDCGELVEFVQALLIDQGELEEEFLVDGIFGKKTLMRVKAFQKENKLKQDGIIGLNTWRRLIT